MKSPSSSLRFGSKVTDKGRKCLICPVSLHYSRTTLAQCERISQSTNCCCCCFLLPNFYMSPLFRFLSSTKQITFSKYHSWKTQTATDLILILVVLGNEVNFSIVKYHLERCHPGDINAFCFNVDKNVILGARREGLVRLSIFLKGNSII